MAEFEFASRKFRVGMMVRPALGRTRTNLFVSVNGVDVDRLVGTVTSIEPEAFYDSDYRRGGVWVWWRDAVVVQRWMPADLEPVDVIDIIATLATDETEPHL